MNLTFQDDKTTDKVEETIRTFNRLSDLWEANANSLVWGAIIPLIIGETLMKIGAVVMAYVQFVASEDPNATLDDLDDFIDQLEPALALTAEESGKEGMIATVVDVVSELRQMVAGYRSEINKLDIEA